MRSPPSGEEPYRDSEKQARAQEIASYAAAVAGSPADFDPRLEAASIDHWLSPGGRTDGPRGG